MSASKETKTFRIAMAGGGTGGHVLPIQSLIEFLQTKPAYENMVEEIFWFGEAKSLEEKSSHQLQALYEKLHFIPIHSGKYRRETRRIARRRNLRDIGLFAVGIVQSIYYLLRYRIEVIFCKGGYVALPVVLAGALLRKKIVVHESDTHSGLVNRIAARFASQVFTGFDDVLPRAKTVGQILSDNILVDEETPIQIHSKPQVLVVGGSQGSQGLYKTLLHILETHPRFQSEFEFTVVLGLLNQDMWTQFDKFPNVKIYGFINQEDMGKLLHSHDIAITRGGTTSLAEQKLYDMKQIIIPIPWTHDQYDNAQWYVQNHKDIMLNQRDDGFEVNLINALIKLRKFHKEPVEKDKYVLISQAKIAIWKELIK